MVIGPAYFRDNPALPYRSAQTRLFGVHKEQQGASREKYAPVVRTAARARGRDTHLSTSALFGVQVRTLFDTFSVWRVLRKNKPRLSAPIVRVYCRRWRLVRRILATIRRCPTVAPKRDFSGSTRNNRVRAEKSTRPWCERRLGLAAQARTCPPRLCLGSKFARFLMHSAFGEFFVKTNRNCQRR